MTPTLGGAKGGVLIFTSLVCELGIETALVWAPRVAPNARIHIQLLGYVNVVASTTCAKTCQTVSMSNAAVWKVETQTNTAPRIVPYQHHNGFTT